MAALLTAQSDGGTGNVGLTGEVGVIVDGTFNGGKVTFELVGDTFRTAIKEVTQEEAFTVAGKASQTLYATVYGGDASTSINVSVL